MKKMSRLLILTSLGALLGVATLQAATTKTTTTQTTTNSQDVDRPNEEKSDVQIDMKKLSEAIGYSIGKNLNPNAFSFFSFDVDALIEGIREGIEGKPSPLSEKEIADMMTILQNVDQSNKEKSDIQIDIKKLSEAIGNSIGKNLRTNAFSLDVDALIKGIREGIEGKPSPLSEKEMIDMMKKKISEMSETNLKAANEFLEKNSKEHGIKEIVPGKLQYKVIQEGTGESIEPHSSPLINYTIYKDGTVFGTSEETGGPIAIPLDQTIPGFSKGIVGMKEGEKRRLYIHPDLGYGTSGQLPPNELLIYDIEAVKSKSDY